MNPYIVEESQARYQQRVDTAEVWRLEQTVRAAHSGVSNRMWAAIGERLIAWGMRLQAQATSVEVSH
ncbi:MAG TPA: hypothetical protein VFU22_07400 [Roseiflexaceae bacterium]|nr:hypothetical protein [Roseiflexaceae bacterium]